ncbi:DUF4244 domain-containing protein [Arthrobacter sp. PAMC25564]|uniref:DUF4244 domain-containing protein n=1 Tax=Arthrobacter sp. PAMC25564 TaxID=2565366 RepID=UPI0010A25C2A|nr:DUF4244 domain-containing protein [Arthrobacter sp. PAMC25564]QCB96473.1 DUF4244 domain-containing protein [Arthrobacter sp. PAMC25564]
MSIDQDVSGKARVAPEFSGSAEVREIYPGASAAGPIQPLSRKRRHGSETGMATAEYAIATLAAVGFAGILVFILRSDEVRGFLLNLIRAALALP